MISLIELQDKSVVIAGNSAGFFPGEAVLFGKVAKAKSFAPMPIQLFEISAIPASERCLYREDSALSFDLGTPEPESFEHEAPTHEARYGCPAPF